MKKFFGDDVILDSGTALELYNEIRALPIVDYHCHLQSRDISIDKTFSNIGELWLEGDHYKWRAMRICGVDERFITGDSSWKDKFFAFASIMPKLIGNPVYYWAHFELKFIFGIELSLNSNNADLIWNKCNDSLKKISVSTLLKQFKVEFIATTDDAIDNLEFHGKVGDTIVAPTFRPDKVFLLDDEYMQALSEASKTKIVDVKSLVLALEKRLDYFIAKGCKITDHGLSNIPEFCLIDEAEDIFKSKNNNLSDKQRERFSGFMLCELAKMCKSRDIAMQWHFSPLRNINSSMVDKVGVDSGFDVFGDMISANNLADILDYLNKNNNLPKIILYTLNPLADKMIATISGAFPNVRIGTAWWFNDTMEGTKLHLKSVMEYAVLGVHLGMLTDSRSFTSYVRHDFFRRILANEVATLVDKGEYCIDDARELLRDICYNNIKNYLKI